MNRLSQRIALITGGAAGIGAATADLFCAEGAAVCLVDANAAALQSTLADLREKFPASAITTCVADIADHAAAPTSVKHCLEALGGLDILINNAAMRNYAALADASPQEWQALLAVNVMGSAGFCRAALPSLRAHGKGSIVNVSSCYAITGRKGMGLYDASKAALLAMTRTLAFEEAAHGVRVNAVCPGSTLTEFHTARALARGKSIETLKTERDTTSLIGRWAEPKEIALPILWLASAEASFITGTSLMVDGGLSIM